MDKNRGYILSNLAYMQMLAQSTDSNARRENMTRSPEFKELSDWFDTYVEYLDKEEERKLEEQKTESMQYVKSVIKTLKKRRGDDAKQYLSFIEDRIIPYLGRKKQLPDSYLEILEAFESGKSLPSDFFSRNWGI